MAEPIKKTQTQTGVKDAYTQYWIDYLLHRFKALTQANPSRSKADIQKELVDWTLQNTDKIYSSFLTMKGNLQLSY